MVDIQNYSRRHINAIVQLGSDARPWKFSWFYCHHESAKRPEAWSLMRLLARRQPEPWLYIGDFNEILSNA